VESSEKVRHVHGPYLPVFLEDLTIDEVRSLSDLDFWIRLTDNWGLDEVFVEYWYNDGYHRNRSMDPSSADLYKFGIIATGMPGDALYYKFSGKDMHGNWNSTGIGVIDVVDNESPKLIQDLSPYQGTTGEALTFRFEVTDEFGLAEVVLSYGFGGNDKQMVFLENSIGCLYEYSIDLPHTSDDLFYSVKLCDGSNNTLLTEEKMIRIIDNDLPIIISDQSDTTAKNGDPFRFRCQAEDNVGIHKVKAEYWFNNGRISSIVLKYEEDSFVGALVIPDDDVGDLRYRICVEDTSGNRIWGDVSNIPLTDMISPSIGVIEDITTYIGWEFSINVETTDNIEVRRILWYGLPTPWIGSKWIGSLKETGAHHVEIIVEDHSENKAMTYFTITILPEDFDSDNDGIPDLFEMEVGLSYLDPLDALTDLDFDGLINLLEYELGSFLDLADSDNDGMPDGWENSYGFDPLVISSEDDPDKDGLSNLEEYLKGSDPLTFNEEKKDEKEDSFGSLDLILAVLIILGIIILIAVALKWNRK
jgi:hypothetical protein